MHYDLVTPPALEPVTLAELKEHARIDGADEDAYLEGLIAAARDLVERHTGRALVTQTWRLTMDHWPGAARDDWWDGVREGALSQIEAPWVELKKAPIAAITSVVTRDEDGAGTTWGPTNYLLARQPNGYGRLVRKSGQTWPVLGPRSAGAIEITFTAGYGTAPTAVPYALRLAIKAIAAHWHENREAVSMSQAGNAVPFSAMSLLAQFRVLR